VQHGLKANRKVLETAASYSHEQGLTSRPVALEEVFAARRDGAVKNRYCARAALRGIDPSDGHRPRRQDERQCVGLDFA